jgi:hypothetical protein
MQKQKQPELDRATFEFTQSPNCVSDEDDCEKLIIECESSLGVDYDKGAFFVLKTNGWSIDSEDDIQRLLDRIRTSLNIKKNV